jgi:hypothetical protein
MTSLSPLRYPLQAQRRRTLRPGVEFGAMSTNSEFLRPALAFEREFGQFRNWWARDKRIVGNAFSLLIYLLSHERSFRITQAKAQRDLALGRDAFLVARRKLEDAGFLTVTEYRYPAGAVDYQGRPIGGHRRMVYTLQDSPPPDAVPVGETETAQRKIRAGSKAPHFRQTMMLFPHPTTNPPRKSPRRVFRHLKKTNTKKTKSLLQR